MSKDRTAIRISTVIEVSFDLDLDKHEVARTIAEAVELELDGINVSTYDDGHTWSVAGPGDPRFIIEGAELTDPIEQNDEEAV